MLRVQLHKNVFAEYFEDYTIDSMYIFKNGYIIKKIVYHPDIQTIYCIEEFKNERNNNTLKQTYYKEDGKTIDYIMVYNKWNQGINTKFYNEEEIIKFQQEE